MKKLRRKMGTLESKRIDEGRKYGKLMAARKAVDDLYLDNLRKRNETQKICVYVANNKAREQPWQQEKKKIDRDMVKLLHPHLAVNIKFTNSFSLGKGKSFVQAVLQAGRNCKEAHC